MIVVVFKYLTRFGIQGITLFPVVFVGAEKYKSDVVLLNHERIHLAQQKELLLVLFYMWYAVELVYNKFKYGSWYAAYRNISFEREAYGNELNADYLKSRSLFGFKNFI